MKKTFVYTDGSTVNNQRRESKKTFGGIGVFFGDNDARNISEPFFEFPITNNRTEIKAVTKAIESFMHDKIKRGDKSKENLIMYLDSQYVIKLITQWIHKWKKNNWKASTGKPVLNKDLIFQLDHIIELYKDFVKIDFQFINAHKSEPKNKSSVEHKQWYGNMMADKLAKEGTTIAIYAKK